MSEESMKLDRNVKGMSQYKIQRQIPSCILVEQQSLTLFGQRKEGFVEPHTFSHKFSNAECM
jgi:hypothetical protein